MDIKKVKLGLILIISIGLVLLVVQNTTRVQAHFLWFTAEIPAILLLFLAAGGGFVLGMLVTLLVQRHKKSKN
jgi:uncharacterized integral membrane protein